jgi:hypothetical protein
MRRTVFYAAPKARGKEGGALPPTLPGGHPLDPRPAFPAASCSRTVLAVKGSLRRAQIARP